MLDFFFLPVLDCSLLRLQIFFFLVILVFLLHVVYFPQSRRSLLVFRTDLETCMPAVCLSLSPKVNALKVCIDSQKCLRELFAL